MTSLAAKKPEGRP
uniref:E. coli plasmid R751 traF (5'end), traG, traH, traI, traJ, traK and traL (5'end) genes of the transfer region n=2 Tax=Enterobacteriaceae TaxID=543 RepID=A2NVD0_ECOLX|nr:hypothetical protein X (traJ 5' region) - Escherichia coli plasmid R751 [Escherichia coli]pir/T08533/ hypothetical protein X - Enterobacter aerogenes plasmid R751 [Klebsiella aerogenes]AAC64477.1 ORFX [Klebsiella aerogenes]CAA38330.1 unnamed protein product [Escherichia coli]CAJ15631.1 TraX protein [uncultured bacterium]